MVLTIAEAKKLTVPRLKEELTKRGLDSTGNKPELLARLTESLHQAAEDLILNDTGDAHSLNEDILNDDLLGSIDGEVDAEKLLAAEPTLSTDEEKPSEVVAEEEPKKEVVLTSPPANGADDAQRARAIRFGLPLTAEILGSDSAKAARAQRFGLPEDAKRLSSDDAKAKRAERFGTNAGGGGADKEKMAARAARFGLPMGESGDKHKEKLAERAKRFGGGVGDDAETAAKKKARLERFGAKAE